MLGKLIKHEWKAVWKFLTIVNAFMVCLTIIGVLGITIMGNRISFDNSPWPAILLMLYIMLYVFGMMAVTYATLIYLGVHFYKSMYSSEGYLTHTLPATPLQLISSKLIVAVSWSWICGIIMIASIFVLCFCANAAAGYPITFADFSHLFRSLFTAMNTSDISILGLIILYGVIFLLGTISGITVVYAAVSLGQLFNKHRILSAVGIYFGFIMACQIIGTILGSILSFTATSISFNGYRSSIMTTAANGQLVVYLYSGFMFFWTVLLLTGSLLITYFVTKKKLNLE